MVKVANSPFAAFPEYKLWITSTVLDISVLAEFHNHVVLTGGIPLVSCKNFIRLGAGSGFSPAFITLQLRRGLI
jgi:hypothetical protein